MLKIMYRKIVNLFDKNLMVNEWSVIYTHSNYSNLEKNNFVEIQNTKSTFFADPFFIEKGNKKYIFGEEYNYKTKKGYIVVYLVENDIYKKIGTALEEDFHLSFPFIFYFEDNYYMIPETKEKNEIRLYKCDQFPLKWNYHLTIKKNISAVDSMIFEFNNLWWLFTNFSPIKKSPESELNIFFSKKGPLTNEWYKHKSNPVVIDSFSGRNAGMIISDKEILRCSHVIQNFYKGKKIKIFKINKLTEDIYEEEQIDELGSDRFKGAFSTHHLYSKNNFTVLDICKKRFKFLN